MPCWKAGRGIPQQIAAGTIFSRVTGFQGADRARARALGVCAVQDWWNATTIGDYWRLWNMPVHKWMLRHVYFPALRAGVPRVWAGTLVFAVRASPDRFCQRSLGAHTWVMQQRMAGRTCARAARQPHL